MIASSFLFSVMQVAVSMGDDTTGISEQIFFRNLISFIMAYFLIRKEHGSFLGKKDTGAP